MAHPAENPLTRFERKYLPEPNSGCWLWTDAPQSDGYGRLQLGKASSIRAHRFAYQAHVGPIPVGLCVLHSCDLPLCVNPAHLFLGTPADNNADMMRKGRHKAGKNGLFGARQSRARLTEEEAAWALHAYHVDRQTCRQIAGYLRATLRSIQKICHRETWLHIPVPSRP